MANSPDKNVRAEKRDSTNGSKMRWFTFQKIALHFAHWNPDPNRPIFRDIRGRNILPVKKCDKMGLNVQPPQSQKWLYHWCFPYFFCASINHRTKLKWRALWWNFVFVLVVFFPKIITFRLFRTHILRSSVGWHHEDLLN